MPYWDSKELKGEDIHSPSLYAWQGHRAQNQINLNSSSGFSSFLLSLQPQVHQIVPCCTCTIHKGYYIVLHSSPILQIIPNLFYNQPPFTLKKKISSALVFKSNIFMVDGYQQL